MIDLRTATVQDDYAWIWSGDDALDTARDDFESEYQAALESGDMERMPLLPGATPTVFWLRHATPELRLVFIDATRVADRLIRGSRRVVALSIVKVENAGLPLKWSGLDPDSGLPLVPPASMAVLEGVADGALVTDLYVAIMGAMDSEN